MARSSLFPKSLDVIGKQLDPIQSLWRNVLIVALEDAVGRHWKNKNYGSYNHHQQSAQEYFTHPNGDFKMVCTLAGFDHEYVRMKARNYFERHQDEKNM